MLTTFAKRLRKYTLEHIADIVAHFAVSGGGNKKLCGDNTPHNVAFNFESMVITIDFLSMVVSLLIL
jgi:hypothetical protein